MAIAIIVITNAVESLMEVIEEGERFSFKKVMEDN